MKTSVADTSIRAYAEIKEEGLLSKRRAQVLAAIKPGRDYSLSELVVLTGLPINTVSGRCNELRKLGKLILGDTRRCSETSRTVHPVKLPVMTVQLELC